MESSVGAEFRAFARLRTLLKQVSTRHPKQEIDLSLGEINFSGSTKIVTTLQPSKNWSKYPPLGGTSDLREAYLNWHQRRSQVSNFSGVDVEPTPGTKQAISSLLFLAASQARAQFCANPVIAIPNPFYPTFGIAGEYAGAEVRLISVLETDYADAIRRLVAEVGHRLTCVILCNPNTPFGHVLTEHELRRVAALASELGFWLIIDECYLDFGVKCSPKSIVHCLLEHKLSCKNIVALHTLSKRSAAPGLRSGFLIGDERIVSCYSQFNRQCGVSNSTLVCTTATQLWDNDSLVEECRSRVIENWELANQLLNDWAGFTIPDAGIFLWLPVTDDIDATILLWEKYSLKVLPGRFLGAYDHFGVNPGEGGIRLALVHDPSIMKEAFARVLDAKASILTC